MLQHSLDVGLADQVGGRVARGAKVDHLDRWVGGEFCVDQVRLGVEGVRRVEWDFEDANVVDGGGDGVHAVRGRTCENLVDAWGAESAEEGIDCLIAADADEEVVWCQGLLRVNVSVAEINE